MSKSPITGIINHLSDTAFTAALGAGIGYLFSRVVQQIDTRAAVVCGLTTGVIGSLFFGYDSNVASKIIGLAALIFLPFKICQRRELPITFKASLAVSGVVIGIGIILGCAVVGLAKLANKSEE